MICTTQLRAFAISDSPNESIPTVQHSHKHTHEQTHVGRNVHPRHATGDAEGATAAHTQGASLPLHRACMPQIGHECTSTPVEPAPQLQPSSRPLLPTPSPEWTCLATACVGAAHMCRAGEMPLMHPHGHSYRGVSVRKACSTCRPHSCAPSCIPPQACCGKGDNMSVHIQLMPCSHNTHCLSAG
jgi:hypothetical protein